MVRTAAAVVASAVLVVSVALLVVTLASPSLVSLVVVPVTAVLVAVSSYCAAAGFTATQWRRVFPLMDGVLVVLFWASGALAGLAGASGAWTLAAVVPGPTQRFWFGDDAPPAAVIVGLSAVLASMSLAMLFTTAQARVPEYSGVISFRRGSVLFPVVITCLVGAAYAAAAIAVASEVGIGTTTVFVTVVLAAATALVRSIQSMHRRVSDAKAELLDAVDALLVALADGNDRDVTECALAFNRAYSRRTALRHPMLPQSMRATLDLVLSRAIDVPLWDAGSLDRAAGGALRHLSREDCRLLLADGSSMIRSALRALH
ncbi:hypothetical protein [Curtobacterium sp. L1-20]|uniref:hypothetical protein n=1 Tax=Curtobacterium sp. L1-20 TaxID=3138181 RepID=UPI003B520F32